MKYHTKDTHISLIRTGDVVETDGVIKTVSRGDIKSGFMGKTLWGDSYRSGTLPVRLVIIETPGYQKATA